MAMAVMKHAMNLDGPRVAPAAGGPARELVVLLHGYGADGDDLIALAAHWQRLLPHAAFASPHAPESIAGFPAQAMGGRQWFSLSSYDPGMLRRDPAHAGGVYREMLDGANRAAPALQGFLDAELARCGLAPERLALVGFSQGTMMALHVGLRRPRAPAAIVGFSGALLGADRLRSEITCRPPVLLLHGDADEIVPVQALFAAAQGLGAADVVAEWHVVPGLGHGIDPGGLALAGRFLATAFAAGARQERP
jgi:phospholipase/carboxylesterase